MNIAEKTVLVTGASRGVGKALVKEALKRGAKRVFAGTRSTIPNTDPRVMALTLDVTNASQIQKAVDEVADLDVLINNAGIGIFEDLTDPGVIQRQLDVNLLGPLSAGGRAGRPARKILTRTAITTRAIFDLPSLFRLPDERSPGARLVAVQPGRLAG